MNKKQLSFQTKTKQTICIVYHPYEFFDAELATYALKGKSLLFADDMIEKIQNDTPEGFLHWLKNIQFYPLINPLTALFSPKKNIKDATDTLKTYDYVVPFEHLSEFIQNVKLETIPQKLDIPSMDFSMTKITDTAMLDTFIERDLYIYDTAKELWQTIHSSDFAPLPKMPKTTELHYEGIVDALSAKEIAGWVYCLESPESQTVCIYRNGEMLRQVKADIMRPGVKQNKNHPTGLCGFHVHFDTAVFHPSDTIKVITYDKTYTLLLGRGPKEFQKRSLNT